MLKDVKGKIVMQKWKNQLVFLGCVLVITGCGKGNNSSMDASLEASTSNIRSMNSISGIDANNNGVRDDIDAYINTEYLVAPQKAAALQMARVIQRELLVDKTDREALKLLALAEDRAVNCIYLKFDRNSPIKPAGVALSIESITTNTKERKSAYLAFSKAMNGTTGKIPNGDTCE